MDLIERLNQLEKHISDFQQIVVDTLDALADLIVPAPAIAFVRENQLYYFKYAWSADLADTPYCSMIGAGWQPINSTGNDRPIWIVKTQWLNGWNLDYFPDYIDPTQAGWDYIELQKLFGTHHEPPAKNAVPYIPPEFVTIGELPIGTTTIYINGLSRQINTLCTITIDGIAYSILSYDTNNTIPKWVRITGLQSATTGTSYASISWPEAQPQYNGVIATQQTIGATQIELYGLTGPIDTSYTFNVNNSVYQIIDFDGDTIVISPALVTDLAIGTPWSLIKLPGLYNTELANMKPGDLILRSQRWTCTVNGAHEAGTTEINVVGLLSEIADRWHSSHDIPPEGQEISHAQSGTFVTINDITYDIIDHEPNARTGKRTTMWKPSGLPTTKIILRSALQSALQNGQELVLKNVQWYTVSVEHIGSLPKVSTFETPQFPDGHIRDCFDFFRIADKNAPARFRRKLHTTEDIEKLFESGAAIPGDLIFHDKKWSQLLPNGSIGDFSTTLTIHDRNELSYLERAFTFGRVWIINNSHTTQGYVRQIKTGFTDDGITTRDGSIYHPAEFIYYAGSH